MKIHITLFKVYLFNIISGKKNFIFSISFIPLELILLLPYSILNAKCILNAFNSLWQLNVSPCTIKILHSNAYWYRNFSHYATAGVGGSDRQQDR